MATRWRIAQVAFASRVVLLLAMSLSCSLLPDFYPGDDVLQFDLRLAIPTSTSFEDGRGQCYCLQGYSCDTEWISRRRISGSLACAGATSIQQDINNHDNKNSMRYMWLDRLYAFILPPVTKWDAARFLTLSVDPWARYPLIQTLKEDIIAGEDQQTCNNNKDTSCEVPSTNHNQDDDGRYFASSEQAHAFLPFLPIAIRYTANFLMDSVPSSILPSTYEATAALSAIIINMFAFVIASISLYDLTLFILKKDALEMKYNATKSSPKEIIEKHDASSIHTLATTAAQLFCFNPAGVFFTTAYSESIFAMLTFGGHAIVTRGQYYQCYMQKTRLTGASCWLWANLYWIPSTILWMLASFSRSNGTFSSIWWLLIGIAKCCSYIQASKGKGNTIIVCKVVSLLLVHVALASLVAMPVLYHDWQGYIYHCTSSQLTNSSTITPAWCDKYERFSLYAHVQRKHWNVGFLKYYEMKQIPNFILALPVLVLSFTAAALWIRHSWNRYINNGVTCLKDALLWAFLALGASSSDLKSTGDGKVSLQLLGPKFLSYYAILAGFAIVGAFLAHVQISTRLICSSCPAFYWFVSSLMIDDGSRDKRVGMLLYFYFALYNIIGVIMHVNWLPWT